MASVAPHSHPHWYGPGLSMTGSHHINREPGAGTSLGRIGPQIPTGHMGLGAALEHTTWEVKVLEAPVWAAAALDGRCSPAAGVLRVSSQDEMQLDAGVSLRDQPDTSGHHPREGARNVAERTFQGRTSSL